MFPFFMSIAVDGVPPPFASPYSHHLQLTFKSNTNKIPMSISRGKRKADKHTNTSRISSLKLKRLNSRLFQSN